MFGKLVAVQIGVAVVSSGVGVFLGHMGLGQRTRYSSPKRGDGPGEVLSEAGAATGGVFKGRWQGDLDSRYCDPKTGAVVRMGVPFRLDIDPDRLEGVRAFTRTSTSRSKWHEVSMGDFGTPRLSYYYDCNYCPPSGGECQEHYGYAQLNKIEDNGRERLEGSYVTTRFSGGTISLHRAEERVVDSDSGISR